MLPREGSAGLPVTTINVDKVKLRLVRINERNLVPSINAEKLTMSFDRYSVDELIEQQGSLVWQGEMAITGERNRPVVTAIPLQDILRDKGPGVYLAAVDRADAKHDDAGAHRDQLGARLGYGADHLYRRRRHGGHGALAVRGQADAPASRSSSTRATTASWPRSPPTRTGWRAFPAGRCTAKAATNPMR